MYLEAPVGACPPLTDSRSNADLAALGILYPLAVFLRHGKVNMELLTGESGPGSDEE